MSTDWIAVHDHGSVYETKVFLTDKDQAYIITIHNGKKKFFRVDAKLLKTGELNFFEKVMETATELTTKNAIDIGLTR